MRKSHSSALNRPGVTKVFLLGAVVFWAVAIIFFMKSHYGQGVQNLNHRANFSLREYLGKGVKLDKRIKVFGFDDETVSWIRAGGLSIEEWADFIRAIDKKKPAAIFIDKLFSLDSVGIEKSRNIKRIERMMRRNVKSSVVVGSYTVPRKIARRAELKLIGPDYQPPSLVKNMSAMDRFTKRRGKYAYGPSGKFQKIFPSFGHIQYDGQGEVYPILRTEDRKLLPHLAFTGWKSKFNVKGGKLFFGKQRIPVNRDSSMLINWVSKSEFYSHIKRAKRNLSRTALRKPLLGIAKGDVVIVLPGMFTGNTDFKQTPFGMLPGGSHLVSLVNSVLQGRWIKSFDYTEYLIVLAAVLGGILGSFLTPVVFSVSLATIILLLSASSLLRMVRRNRISFKVVTEKAQEPIAKVFINDST